MQEDIQDDLNQTHPFILFPEDEDVCEQINERFPKRKRAFTKDQKILIDKFAEQIHKKFSQPGQFKQTEELKGQAMPQQQETFTQNFRPQQNIKVQNTQRYYQPKAHGYVFQTARTKQTVSYNNYKPYQQQNIQQYQNRTNYNNYNYQQNIYKRPTYTNYYRHYDTSKIDYPDQTRFNYKPSYYNYYQNYGQQNNKQNDWSDWYKNYIDKYGIKIRKVDINDINKKINNNKNINHQYWNNRKRKNDNQQNDADNYNKVIQQDDSKPKPQIQIPSDQKKDDDQGKVFISGLISNVINKKQKEEMDSDDDTNQADKKKPTISNSLINTFKNILNKNQIDDLQDLLKSSKKYETAKSLISNGKYTDPDFPPNEYSIYGFGDRQDYSLEDLRSLPWQRPEVFFEGMPITVYKTLDSNDIEQGGLGDCYFLAAISAIAEYPQRLERIFLTKEYQPNGIYVLALCINGVWQDVVLDDMVPCTKYTKKPAFNRSKSQELWVILLEKAWAKVHGGYMNIAAGLTREALRDLTGASAITYFTSQEPEALWERLVQANHNKYVMTAGSDNLNNGSDAYIEKIGIAGSHAYSLLEVFELKQTGQDYEIVHPEDNKEGMRIERLVKLRNPWGKGEWKGDWSDDSYKWTSKLKRELGYIKDDDGVFFMTYNDFIKYYSDIQICYYHDDYKYSAIKLQSDNKVPDFIQFQLDKPGKYYFSLNQKNRRFFPKKKNYVYSNCTFLLAHIKEDGSYDYIGGAMKADKENWIAENVKAGKYIAMLKTPWKSFVNEFSFSIYGPQVTEINEIQTHELPNNFITKLMISHFKEYPHDLVQNFAQQGHKDITYTTFDNKGGFGYIAFQNKSKDIILQATVEMLGSVNVEMVEPFQGLKPSVEVSPGEIEVIPYYATKLPYTTQMRLLTTFKNPNFSKNIKEQVRKSSTILSKNLNGKPVDIKVYVLYHSEGLAMLYVNNTTEYTINEEIEFDMQNCHIDGTYGSYVEVCVKPGQERLLQIIKDEGVSSYTAKITKLYYKVV